jgi:hypothetical protein
MFDANAAHIPCGELFFAEVHAVDAQIKSFGVSAGDIVLCKHNLKSGDRFRVNDSSMIITCMGGSENEWLFDEHSDDWSWLVYSGRPSGNGFINDKWKSKALDFLGGEWIDL